MFKVHIAEDEPFIRMELREIINWEDEGFTIVGDSRNGKEALKKLEEEPVDLVITDIEMPRMGGIELIQTLRDNDCNCEVIFLTGFSEFEYAQKGVKLGIVDYLLKPVERGQLIDALHKVKAKLQVNNRSNVEKYKAHIGGYKKSIIIKAQQYVNENLEKDISLDIVADYLKLSKNYFWTLYKQETGETLLDYIVSCKMDKAKELLINENLKVYEVCERLGYLDKAYFSKLFKKHVGVTPLEYKRKGEN